MNDRTKPLVWSVDGKRYSPSGLVMKMYALAEWSGAPVAVQGPIRWHLGMEGDLARVARATSAELPADGDEEPGTHVDLDASARADADVLESGGRAS